jgi:hypothetical protein
MRKDWNGGANRGPHILPAATSFKRWGIRAASSSRTTGAFWVSVVLCKSPPKEGSKIPATASIATVRTVSQGYPSAMVLKIAGTQELGAVGGVDRRGTSFVSWGIVLGRSSCGFVRIQRSCQKFGGNADLPCRRIQFWDASEGKGSNVLFVLFETTRVVEFGVNYKHWGGENTTFEGVISQRKY